MQALLSATREPTCTAKAKSASPVVPCREVKRAGSKAEGESYSVILNDSSAVLQNATTDFNVLSLCILCDLLVSFASVADIREFTEAHCINICAHTHTHTHIVGKL